MKKIWIINHYAEPPEGGKYLRHYTFARKLIERGYDVTIFTASTIHNTKVNFVEDGKSYVEKSFSKVPFVFVKTRDYFGNGKARALNMLDYYFNVKKVVKKFEKPDVIYTSGPHPLIWLAARAIARRTGAKLVVETRDLWPETLVCLGKLKRNSLIARAMYRLEKSVYKSADRLIFTLPGADEYLDKIGIDKDKSTYINNGIDLEEFLDKIQNKVYYNEAYSDFKGFKVIFTGALGMANGLDRILESAKLLKDNKDIKIFFFGYGAEEENLRKIAVKQDLDNVVFMGKVDKSLVPSIIKDADLSILSLKHMPELFKYGLSPNKLFEYLAAGSPVISNVECGYDILEKTGAGITVDSSDPKALADGILRFYNMTDDEYKSFSDKAFETAKSFDFDILTDKLVEVIEK